MATISGGDKLTKILESIGEGARGSVNAGFLPNALYPDGTNVASVAFWNEFGHQGPFPAPPRPFMRTAVADDAGTWVKTLAAALKAYDYDGATALGVAGEIMMQSIREHIREVDAPELSDTTKRLREKFGVGGRDKINAREVRIAAKEAKEGKPMASGTGAKPLNFTGTMIGAVNFEVKE